MSFKNLSAVDFGKIESKIVLGQGVYVYVRRVRSINNRIISQVNTA